MFPHQLLWAFGALVVIAILAAAFGKPRRRRAETALDRPWPLQAAPTLLSAPEQVLYRRLVEALPHHIVLCQVHLLQALQFKRGGWNRGLANRINQLSVDFLIVRPDTSIVAAVELDDGSHGRADRREADARKTHALKSADIPLFRWQARQMPDGAALVAALSSAGVESPLRKGHSI